MLPPVLRWSRRSLVLSVVILAASALDAKTIELTTREVTEPDITASPDGRELVFTLLGHLFRMPMTGGAAEQITFGPCYDAEPAFSPDGSRLAFISDRDGSGGNVFVLDLATLEVRPLTRERHAGQPAWSRDGRSIAYCRVLAREEHPTNLLPRFFGARGLREVRRVPAEGGEAEVVAAPRLVGSLVALPDGRWAWSVVEPTYAPGSPFPSRTTARLEAAGPDGTIGPLRALEADPGRLVAGPAGDGLYGSGRGLQFLPLPDGPARPVLAQPPGGGRAGGPFAVAPDNRAAFLGQDGQLLRVDFATGTRQPVAFEARVRLEVREPARARWAPPDPGDPPALRSVLGPQLTPDGRGLVFMAAGDLWRQPLGGGPAERLPDSGAPRRDPAVSPDGRQVAFAQNSGGHREAEVVGLSEGSRPTRLASLGDRSWGLLPSWSRDGRRLVFQQTDALFAPTALMAVEPGGGAPVKVADASAGWTARPHFAPDGRSLYFTGRSDAVGTLYRLALTEGAKPVAVTDLEGHVSDGLVSPDGNWLAFRRNAEIWFAPLGSEPVREADVRRLSAEGGRDFSFAPDSSAVVYASGARVWRHPLPGGERQEIPIRLPAGRPEVAPLLLRRVRVLDFEEGGFGPEVSLLVEGGRIRWLGAEDGREVPAAAEVVEGGGRYVIPGLFDLHVHAAWADQEANHDALIAYGITSVRDTGGRLDLLNALADRGERTADPLPRFFYSGEIFEGARPNWGDAFLQITGEEEARAHVRLWKELGAHFIKVYPSLPWPLQRAAAEEAHRAGLPMVGHGLSTEEIVKSVTLGYAVLEHGPNNIYDDLLQLLAASGTQWDPTLAILGGHTLTIRDDPARLEEGRFRRFVPEWTIREAQGGGMFGRMPDQMMRAGWRARLARIRAARDRGVALRAGTDSLMTGTFFGPSLHWELEHLVEAGLSPLEAIRDATEGAAETVGAGEQLGRVEAGRLADLVVLEADPLADIRNTRSIWRVVRSGRMYDPETLRPAGGAVGAD